LALAESASSTEITGASIAEVVGATNGDSAAEGAATGADSNSGEVKTGEAAGAGAVTVDGAGPDTTGLIVGLTVLITGMEVEDTDLVELLCVPGIFNDCPTRILVGSAMLLAVAISPILT
jgi:hypothetical protein